MASYGYDINESLNTGMKIAQFFQDKQDKQDMMDMYNRVYHPEMFTKNEKNPSSNIPTPPNGFNDFVASQSSPSNYEKGTGFGGQITKMPKDVMSVVDPTEVTTAPLRQEGQIMDTSAPTGFATDQTTDYNPTSPYGTNEQTGAQSPADMPYGFGAIPKDYQPMEGTVDTASQDSNPTVTIEQGPLFSTMPDDFKAKLANARSEDEYNNILATYKTDKQPNVYDKTMQDLTSAKSQVNAHQEELRKIRTLSDQMRSKGFFKEAQNFENKAYEIEKNLYESTDTYYKTISKANDLKASLAQSFLNSIKTGVDTDKSWQETIMKAHSMGIPDLDKYIGLPRDQRVQVAQSIIDDSVSTKENLKLDLETRKATAKKEEQDRRYNQRERFQVEKERNTAFEQNLKLNKFSQQIVNDEYRNSNLKIKNLDNEIKVIDKRLELINKGDKIIDDFGNLMTPAETQQEATSLTNHRESLQTMLDSHTLHFNTIKPYIPKDQAKQIDIQNKTEVNQKTIDSTVSKITPEIFTQVTNDINNNPNQVPAITKAWEELHPGTTLQVDPSAGTIQVIAKEGATTTKEPAAPATKEEQIKAVQSKINEVKRKINPKERFKQNNQKAINIAKERIGAVSEFFTNKEETKANLKELDDLNKQLKTLQSS